MINSNTPTVFHGENEKKPVFFIISGLIIIIVGLICWSSFSPALYFVQSSRMFESDQVSFEYPGNWRTIEEIFGKPSNQKLDKELNADILITVTNAIPSSFGEKYTAWCTLLSKPALTGQKLLDLVSGSYSILKSYQDSEVSLREISSNGNIAVEKIYKRPRGEPWYQVRDVWIQHGSTVFILSCYSIPSAYAKNEEIFFEIQNSIVFK